MNAEEIVKRLRDIVYDNEFDAEAGFAAADLIERQAKALEEAEKALLRFATEAETYEPDEGDNDYPIWGEQTITIGHLRRARAALATIRAARGGKENG